MVPYLVAERKRRPQPRLRNRGRRCSGERGAETCRAREAGEAAEAAEPQPSRCGNPSQVNKLLVRHKVSLGKHSRFTMGKKAGKKRKTFFRSKQDGKLTIRVVVDELTNTRQLTFQSESLKDRFSSSSFLSRRLPSSPSPLSDSELRNSLRYFPSPPPRPSPPPFVCRHSTTRPTNSVIPSRSLRTPPCYFPHLPFTLTLYWPPR